MVIEMPFGDLETMSIAEYIDRERYYSGLWFFMHIPKTAGSSFSTELTNRVTPYRNIEVDYNDSTIDFDMKLIRAVDSFVHDMRATRFRSASGHVPWELLGRILAVDPSARIISFLRNPIDRVISEYRYQLTPMNPQHRAFEMQFPNFERYIESRNARNQMTRFMFGDQHEPSCDELIAHIREKFTFVGLVEMYSLSFSCMFTAIGIPNLHPVEFERRTESTVENRITISPELVTLIQELNHLDQVAYNYVRSILLRHRDDWYNLSSVT
jgi:hypothetical protein